MVGLTTGGSVSLKTKLMVGFLILIGIFIVILCVCDDLGNSEADQHSADVGDEVKRLEKELKTSQDELKKEGWTFDENGIPYPPKGL